MIFGFTGTQKGMLLAQATYLHKILLENMGQFHHGDCIGADAEAHSFALACGYDIYIHPPTNQSKRAFCSTYKHMYPQEEYLIRNRCIVDACDVLIAVPYQKEEELRSGTWSTIRYAKKINKPVIFIFP